MEARPSKIVTPFDEVSYGVIGAAMAVHTELGPGFPEEMYQRALGICLAEAGLAFQRELPVPVCFRGHTIGTFELDFVVEQNVVVETKALAALAPVHEQQVIAYLAASGLPIGLLINFGAARLEHHRIFPPKAVQRSAAYVARQTARHTRTPEKP